MDLIYRFDPYRPIDLARPTDTESVLRQLTDGNRRLVDLIDRMQHATIHGDDEQGPTIVPVDLLSMGLPFFAGAAPDQAPFALVLACSDARVPVESIFDQSFNALFVVRIAGNVLGTECLGSIDYAVRNLQPSLKAVVVMGHTGCGAITAAVDAYLNPDAYAEIAFTHALRSLVDRVLAAVRAAARSFERQCGQEVHRHAAYRAALIEATVYMNSAITAFDVAREIASIGGDSSLGVFYGACEINTMKVQGDPSDAAGEPRLRPAPRASDEFIALGDQIARAIAAAKLT